jgi:dynein heavy chain, axonemal
VKRIYMTLAQHKLDQFPDEIKELAEPLVQASQQLYHSMSDTMLPTPARCHYLFNLRDVSKIWQGLYMVEAAEKKEEVVRVW